MHETQGVSVTEKQTVLIIDDDPLSVEILNGLLSDDHNILIAHNGEEGLAQAVVSKPDLILLDIIMPGMDGYEVFRQIRENTDLCDIPVLFITAMSEVASETRGLDMGANDYVVKPYNPELVRLRVRNHLKIKQQHDLLVKHLEEVEELNRQLIKERETIKLLKGLIPICCVCKKIRDDEGYWKQIETYISEHSDAQFTHGYCPDCAGNMKDQYAKSIRVLEDTTRRERGT